MTDQKAKVYYDGGCPVCRREIGLYKNMKGAETMEWVDVSNPAIALPAQIDREEAMARFHVQDREGALHDGAAAFSQMWLQIPKMKWLGRLSGLPILAGCFEITYRIFLKIRPLYRNKSK